jgi:hypothetical protein
MCQEEFIKDNLPWDIRKVDHGELLLKLEKVTFIAIMLRTDIFTFKLGHNMKHKKDSMYK